MHYIPSNILSLRFCILQNMFQELFDLMTVPKSLLWISGFHYFSLSLNISVLPRVFRRDKSLLLNEYFFLLSKELSSSKVQNKSARPFLNNWTNPQDQDSAHLIIFVWEKWCLFNNQHFLARYARFIFFFVDKTVLASATAIDCVEFVLKLFLNV